MRVTVCTGWHSAGYALYGENFVAGFDRHWPKNIRLLAYVEEPFGADKIATERTIIERDVMSRVGGLRDFMRRHQNIPEHCGRAPIQMWKEKERAAGYSFRFDAVKFCKQLCIPGDVAEELPDGDILVWLDGDVVSFADVPEGFVESLLGDSDLCYLGRGDKHSEIGFWAVRLNTFTRGFLRSIARAYLTDRFLSLREWHSAFVFDHYRRIHAAFGVKARDLTPGGRGHVWPTTKLAAYTAHLKGDRKTAGKPVGRK